jgi:hypothetical protein
VGKVSESVSISRQKGRWRAPRLGNAVGRTLGLSWWPLMAPADGTVSGRGEQARARCTTRLGFIGGRNVPSPRRDTLALTHSTTSSLDRRAQGEPAADRWTASCADGGEGEDSMWRGRGLQGPWSAPSLGKKRPQDDARGPGRRGGHGACAGAPGALTSATSRRSAQINSLFEMEKLQKFE